MIIVCPKCSTKFRLPDTMSKPLSKARCSFCGNIFLLADGMGKEDFETIAGSTDYSDEFSAASKNENNFSSSGSSSESLQQNEDNVASNAKAAAFKQDTVQAGSYEIDDFKDGGSDKPKKKKGRRLGCFVFIGVLFFFGGIAAVFVLVPHIFRPILDSPLISSYLPSNFIKKDTLTLDSVANNATNAESLEAPVPISDDAKDISLRNVRQYSLQNEKLGIIYVIEGKAVNNYFVPKDLIKIEGSLFDSKGQVVASKQQYAGVTVSFFQLQVLNDKELENALNNQVEILTNNTNVQPGAEVPFMIVFQKTPNLKDVKEFGIRVIEAKTPNQ